MFPCSPCIPAAPSSPLQPAIRNAPPRRRTLPATMIEKNLRIEIPSLRVFMILEDASCSSFTRSTPRRVTLCLVRASSNTFRPALRLGELSIMLPTPLRGPTSFLVIFSRGYASSSRSSTLQHASRSSCALHKKKSRCTIELNDRIDMNARIKMNDRFKTKDRRNDGVK